jgi:hypothetical protein
MKIKMMTWKIYVLQFYLAIPETSRRSMALTAFMLPTSNAFLLIFWKATGFQLSKTAFLTMILILLVSTASVALEPPRGSYALPKTTLVHSKTLTG